MNLSTQLANELKQLAGLSTDTPNTIELSHSDGIDLAIDFTVVDTISCSFREIRLRVPALVGAEFAALKQWAERLSERVTYLLENIGPLEADPDSGQVLIRSNPPDQSADESQFYEIILQSHSNGNFSLRRYRSEAARPGREQVDMQTTHEVLTKLANDLVETIPGCE